LRPEQPFGVGRSLAEATCVPTHRLSALTLPSPRRGEGHFT
jgi:hypothetical protein